MIFDGKIFELISAALSKRSELLSDPTHHAAGRLFNGFTEECKDLVIDLLGRTAVIHCYGNETTDFSALADHLKSKLDFLQAILLKRRNDPDAVKRNGVLIYGEKCDSFIREHNIRYAIDLMMNHDNSFYADTRLLRKYLLENMRGKRVLNTFAYTGSLGAAAAAGGAEFVLQSDLSGKFMQLAYRTASLNGFAFTRKNFRSGDFFAVTGALRKENAKFDCVILDPPFFSSTGKGVIDLANNPLGVVNKVRPLTADNGELIIVNNSLYLSGREFMEKIDTICNNAHWVRKAIIPIPEDFCINCSAESAYPADPAPFNHPTKIVILQKKPSAV